MKDTKLVKSVGISLAALVPVLLVQVFGVEMGEQIAATLVALIAPVVDKLRRMHRSE